ncbi:S8 family serine peptidase [Pedobacter alpinus]|uniref:S8 family serine peptidase n=1 Tax=Pedobacter alpinus TaxID=1590643 RepID=A0ABW5TRH3_9SPHI
MFKKLITICLTVLATKVSYAQEKQVLVTKKQFDNLTLLSSELSTKNTENKQKAFALARKNNWIIFKEYKDGTIISLQGVDDFGFPLYLTTYNNTIAAGTTNTNSIYNGGSLGLSLSGSSNNISGKMGIWDGGSILINHQEFASGRIEQIDLPESLSSHATHVAGTLVATGVNPIARGMAWGLKKLYAYDFNKDDTEMTLAASQGMLVSNHSYGFIAGWDYNSDVTPPRWEYYGYPESTEDYKFGFYDNTAKNWDLISYNAPFYLIVKSAGNNRNQNGPTVGTEYYGYESTSSSTFVSKGPRPTNISNNNGYDILSTTSNAKNILTVGAVNGLPFGSNNPTDIQISSFSSWGPTDDGRIKPDIVANGVSLTSTNSSDTRSYSTLSGTSMSAPNVSGSILLLQEYYSQLNTGSFMRSATLKGLIINTANEAGSALGPDYIYGWGLLNIENAANIIKLRGNKSIITERTLSQGEIYNLQITSSGYGPLKVTICWTDPEGKVVTSGTINDRTPKLVNDLDLRLIQGVTTFFPWKLNPLIPANAATNADNIVDNVEQISIPNAVPGQTYTLRVSHKGTLTKGPQNYSIIASGVGGVVYCTSAANSTADSRIEQVQLGSINNTVASSCRSYTNFTDLSTELEAGKSYPFTINLGTCGANEDKIAAIYADWNSDGDFNDEGESLAKSSVFNQNGIFTGNITVPANVISGNSSILRIVLNETTNPNSIIPCGSYVKGETQDYKINFIKSTTDVGVIAINSELENLCPTTPKKFSVRLKNFGGASISNIPITFTLSSNNTVIQTITENFNGTILPNYELNYTFNAVLLNLQNATNYIITVKTALGNDIKDVNDATTKSFTTSTPQNAVNLNASVCDNAADYYQLNGSGDGFIYWYASANSAVPLEIGNNVYTNTAPISNTYYAGLNSFRSYFGAVNKNQYSGGQYSGNFGPKPIITVKAPMVLDSALLYVSKSGQLTFTVETLSGVVLSSQTINVERTKTTVDVSTVTNLIDDDPNDPGKVYKIGLEFPAAGTYYIGISFNGATIFRSNVGVNNIPINLGNGIISLTGANSATTGNITNAYYYFYNMLFKALGCPTNTRQAVTLGKPLINQMGNTLTSTPAFQYQWFLNGNSIDGATNQTHIAVSSGLYSVNAINSSGCISRSDNFNYVISSIKPSDGEEIGLKAFPVPANDLLNLAFEVNNRSNLNISLINSLGQVVYNTKENNFIGKYTDSINVKNHQNGSYILSIKFNNNVYTQKISIMH